jgi:hypothetical protein
MKHITFRTKWTLLTTLGLAGGLVAGVLLGMPVGQIANAMIATAFVTCVVGGVLGTVQAMGLRKMLRRPVWWIAATTVGIGIGLATGVVIVEQIGIRMTGNRLNVAHLSSLSRAVSFIAIGLVCGTFLGIFQWLVLRVQMPQVRHWVPCTAIALAIAFSGSSILVDLTGTRIFSAAGALVFLLGAGAAFGFLTSRPLQRAT